MVYPTKDEIINFFSTHSGFMDVYRISELLIAPYHSNMQNEEWQHVKDVLHELKSEGFLLIQNEGQDIYHEKFSSTPDRIKRYYTNGTKFKKESVGQKNSGEIMANEDQFDKLRSLKDVEQSGKIISNHKRSESNNNQSPIINIKDSQIHFGKGDNVGKDKTTSVSPRTKGKNLEIIISLAALVVAVVSIPWWPNIYQFFNRSQPYKPQILTDQAIATSTLNIADILEKTKSFGTSFEQQNFLKMYKDKEIQGSGTFADFSSAGDVFVVTVNIPNNKISCVMSNSSASSSAEDLQQKLLILKKGSQFIFTGTFTSGYVYGGGWDIKDCAWLNK